VRKKVDAAFNFSILLKFLQTSMGIQGGLLHSFGSKGPKTEDLETKEELLNRFNIKKSSSDFDLQNA
jgi:hypothetical protein